MKKTGRAFWIRVGIIVSAAVILLLGGIVSAFMPLINKPASPTATATSIPPTASPVPAETIETSQTNTYYVSPVSGSDSNPGSIVQPWKTVQHAVDSVVPGDTIYLREGVYEEQVIITTSGLSDLPITLTSYFGETATIDGRKNYSTCDYDKESPAISSSGNVSYWIIQNLNIQNICSTYSIRFGWFGEAVTNHITISNNRIKGAIFTVGNYQLIEGNSIDGTGYSSSSGSGGINDSFGGYSIPNDTNVDDNTHHNIYRNNYIHSFSNYHARGIWTQGRTHDSIIEGNTIENIWSTGLGQCIDLDGAGNIQWRQTVRNNNSKDCSYVGIQLENVFDSLVENNRVFAEKGGSAGMIIINYSASIGCGVGGESDQYGDINGDNNCKGDITNNIIRQNLVYKQGSWDPGYGALVNWSVGGLKILGNTFYATEANLNGAINFQDTAVNTSQAVIQNNIFYNGGGSAICVQDLASFDMDNHNLLYRSNGDDVYGTGKNCFATYSLSSYQLATGQGQGSVQANPLFVNESLGDFHLQPSSPAIDAGTDIGINVDFDGNTRPQGSGFDIGVYEYIVNTTNTSIPQATTATSVP